MSAERLAAVERLHRAVGAIAAAHEEGVLLLLEAEPASLKRFVAVASREHVGETLTDASHRAMRLLSPSHWARTGWNRYEFLLQGPQHALAERARRLLADLLAEEACGILEWRAVLTHIFPGDVNRTLSCDPGYDLALVNYSAVVWVEPYRGDDWQASQRYPTTEILWRR